MQLRKRISRPFYLARLAEWRDRTDTVKVITGIRGSGKSSLARDYARLLQEGGVPESNILYLDLEQGLTGVTMADEMLSIIQARLPAAGRIYLFLDGVTVANQWAILCDKLIHSYDIDIYVVIANGHVLTGENRKPRKYVILRVQPLSFQKFMELYPPNAETPIPVRFHQFMTYGSLPVMNPDLPAEKKVQILSDCIEDIRVNDVLSTYNDLDFQRLKQTVQLVLKSTTFVSPQQLAQNLHVMHKEAERYLRMVEDEYFVYYVPLCNLRSGQVLEQLRKYYGTDIGLLNFLADSYPDRPDSLRYENTVYLELLRRGFDVYTGTINSMPVTFYGRAKDRREYYQVAASFTPEKLSDAVSALQAIPNSGRKVILTGEQTVEVPEGIECRRVMDWLLEPVGPDQSD